jgi:hypothetical protein
VTTPSGYASIQKRGRGGGCPASDRRRRRHGGEGEVAEKRRQKCNTDLLLLKHPNATLATYV